MKPERTHLFKQQCEKLRPSQKDQCVEVIKKILNDPEIGTPGTEEFRKYLHVSYEDKYGKRVISYRRIGDRIRFISNFQISLKI